MKKTVKQLTDVLLRKNEKTVKAWAIYDTVSKTLLRFDSNGDYMIGAVKLKRNQLHETFEVVPCTISFEVPTKKPLQAKSKKV